MGSTVWGSGSAHRPARVRRLQRVEIKGFDDLGFRLSWTDKDRLRIIRPLEGKVQSEKTDGYANNAFDRE